MSRRSRGTRNADELANSDAILFQRDFIRVTFNWNHLAGGSHSPTAILYHRYSPSNPKTITLFHSFLYQNFFTSTSSLVDFIIRKGNNFCYSSILFWWMFESPKRTFLFSFFFFGTVFTIDALWTLTWRAFSSLACYKRANFIVTSRVGD